MNETLSPRELLTRQFNFPYTANKELETWMIDKTALGNKQEALRRIQVCQNSSATRLDLRFLRLTTCPPLVSLTLLTELNLSHNKLTNLSLEITQMTTLKVMYISNNNLRTLPIELSDLTFLELLDLSENPNLHEIPLALGLLQNLRQISTRKTPIPYALCDSIIFQCRFLRYRGGVDSFQDRLNSWKTAGGGSKKLKELHDLKFQETEVINDWLFRLEKTRDFRGAQSILAHTVCGILKTVVENPEFKELFMNQIKVNNEHCQDRAAMALNEIYISWKIINLPLEAPLRMRLEILIGCAKTLTLRQIISSLIDEYQKKQMSIERESVEIYLYYETLLRKPLNLITAIEQMAYDVIGQRKWIEIDFLSSYVNDQYLDTLVAIPQFVHIAENNLTFLALWEEKQACYSDLMDDLDIKKPETTDELSIEYLNYSTELNKLMKASESQKLTVFKEWIKKTIDA